MMNKFLSRLPRPVAYMLYLLAQTTVFVSILITLFVVGIAVCFACGLPVVAIASNFAEVGYGFGLLISTIVVGMPVVWLIGAILISVDFEAEREEFNKLYTPRKKKEKP